MSKTRLNGIYLDGISGFLAITDINKKENYQPKQDELFKIDLRDSDIRLELDYNKNQKDNNLSTLNIDRLLLPKNLESIKILLSYLEIKDTSLYFNLTMYYFIDSFSGEVRSTTNNILYTDSQNSKIFMNSLETKLSKDKILIFYITELDLTGVKNNKR